MSVTSTEYEKKTRMLKLLKAKADHLKYNSIDLIFPDTGPFRRELYPKQMEFMKRGATCNQRAVIAANRTGKSLMGAYEVTLHLTGLYPDWWEGKRFVNPIKAWVCGLTNEWVKGELQPYYLGDTDDLGTGFIPKHLLGKAVRKPGCTDGIESVKVKHVSGGWSKLTFKTYEQGRKSYQGAKLGAIHFDEQCPEDIYTEGLTRLPGGGGIDENGNIVDGVSLLTFTPLMGLTPLVEQFVPQGLFPEGGIPPEQPHKWVCNLTWEDVPHLTEEAKKELYASYKPHERDARSKGIPSLGSGSIFPVPESKIVVDPFEPPVWWRKAFGMDFGWDHPTAVVWGAQDPSTKVIYIWSEHRESRTLPESHAVAMKGRGAWIPGTCDPSGLASRGAMGNTDVYLYSLQGFDLYPSPGGPGSKDVRILKVLQMFESGMLKIFSTCTRLLGEIRVYHRDEKGNIAKTADDLVDALQYLICEFDSIAVAAPDPDAEDDDNYHGRDEGRDPICGY